LNRILSIENLQKDNNDFSNLELLFLEIVCCEGEEDVEVEGCLSLLYLQKDLEEVLIFLIFFERN
jgi:hypothetical protein